ncbi:unnamed protein product [Paramecium octaurelia]|uniref:PX domain-containing protein n=1 Tax=Paramecium octaurelia TaxID=43137 RepID=A0A8S1T0D0_PAROT|nr:unnamed protein product [Paramecium octaurelia]
MIVKHYSVKINNLIENNKVHYQIIVTSSTNPADTKTTMNRYSELKDFHEQLIKNINLLKLQLQLPEFPKRSLFSKTNKNQEKIIQRQQELELYFNQLFSIDKILSLAPVQLYLPIETPLNQQMKINVSIESYTVYDDVVIYSMRFKNKITKEEWIYKQRYSEIKNIHDALVEQGYKGKLPPFPTRKLFGQTNENPETIEKRREDLEVYLNAIFSTQEIYDNEIIQFLIADSKKYFETNKKLEEQKKLLSILHFLYLIFINQFQLLMQASSSVHSTNLDKQPKYSQFVNAQLYSGYRVRGKDHSKYSFNQQLSPTNDQKIANNLSASQSYVNAMKALQDKIKYLETENQNLQSLISSGGLIKSFEIKQRHVSAHQKPNENQQIRDLELKLAQVEIEKQQIIEENEQKIQQLQDNLMNIAQQSDLRYREQLEQIQQLQDQLDQQGENNQNYRIKINSQTQAIQQEKLNNNNLEQILDQEKRETKFLIEKNEQQQEEISKLKEQLLEIHTYMNWYTKQYEDNKFQKLQEETMKYKNQIHELTSQVEQYKELNLKLQFGLEHKKQELEKSELKRVKKLSESNIKIDQLKQQLINLSSNSILHTQSPRETFKKCKQSAEIVKRTQNLRNYRQQNNDSKKQLPEQPCNSMFNSPQESYKIQQNDSQSSVFSRLIVKTQEENFLTQQKSEDRNNIGNIIDEHIQTIQLSANQQEKHLQIQPRIQELNDQLKILNQKYEEIESVISQLTDLKIKREKRQLLLQIIDKIQDINKELNTLVAKQKATQQF